MKKYNWAVVGGGIAGIIASEILTREGHSVVLIEKNEMLASETSREFHEWMHLGSLFTLLPDKLRTLKYILGAVDDLFEFYSSYENMNMRPTEHGINIIDQATRGWFNADNNIYFKYRIKNRKITIPWIIGVARSIFLIRKIKSHDWLRRRAGVLDLFRYSFSDLFSIMLNLFKHKEKYYSIQTPDVTMNSRVMMRDLVSTSIAHGLEILNNNDFLTYSKTSDGIVIRTDKETLIVDNLVLCNGKNISKYIDATVNNSYAPLAVVKNVTATAKSFVELDYFPSNCINMITKEEGVGLIGGISFASEKKCKPYIERVFEKHKKYIPEMEILTTYNGIKSEIIVRDEPRNYLYHINEIEKDIWMIIPGKYTLGFSIGPEFYRKVYYKNPKKYFKTAMSINSKDNYIANTVWQDAIINYNKKD